MNQKTYLFCTYACALFLLFACWPSGIAAHPANENDLKTTSPFLLMENRGQILDQDGHPRPDVLFMARQGSFKVVVRKTGLSYQFEQHEGRPETDPLAEFGLDPEKPMDLEPVPVNTYRLDLELAGANPAPELVLGTPHPYYENYYNVPSAPDGILGVRAFEQVTLRDVYPGIDWVIYSFDGRLKYDFIVHPGADPNQIRLRYAGDTDLHLNADGSLTVRTPLGEVSEAAPVSFSGAGKRSVDSRFVQQEDGSLGFALGDYAVGEKLVIDPELSWATYYGGEGTEYGNAVKVDFVGNVFLAGYTTGTTGIATVDGFQVTFAGGTDAYLAKFNDEGVRLWGTYYGGVDSDVGHSITTDLSGNVFLVGETRSLTNIATAGSDQETLTGSTDGFIVKFNGVGEREWGTYFGGTAADRIFSVASEPSGDIYFSGLTSSLTNIATSGSFQESRSGTSDVFLAKFSGDGVRIWSTYFGGSWDEFGGYVGTGPLGSVFLSGYTRIGSGLATPGSHQSNFGGGYSDTFLAKFDSDGNRLWATYLGGPGIEICTFVCADPLGNAFVGGRTTTGYSSPPTSIATSDGHQPNHAGGIGNAYDAFLVKFDENGNRVWGTYYGGTGLDYAVSASSDLLGNLYLAGYTQSTNNIASVGSFQENFSGNHDVYVAKFNSQGQREWGTYFGGFGYDADGNVCVGLEDNFFLAGYVGGSQISTPDSHQPDYGGNGDAFLAKFTPESDCLEPPSITCPPSFTVGTSSSGLGDCSGLAEWTHPTEENNTCDPRTLFLRIDDGTPTAVPYGAPASELLFAGTHTLVYTSEDGNGQTDDCFFTITVVDDTPPTIFCPADDVVSTDPGQCSTEYFIPFPSAVDDCGDPTISYRYRPADGNCQELPGSSWSSWTTAFIQELGVGQWQFEWRAVDFLGYESSCIFCVTVMDNEAPTALCQDVTAQLDANGTAMISPAQVGIMASSVFVAGQSLGNGASLGVDLGDVDGDGDLDAFVANIGEGNRVWRNNGTGFFTDSGQSLGSGFSYKVKLGDLDGDGDLDAFVANFNDPNRVWLNNGSGSFTDSGQSLGGSFSYGVSLGDVDGDGDLDALVVNLFGQANKVWLNNGAGIFTDSGQALGTNGANVALADLDGDGDLDAFIAMDTANKVWLNNGAGTFTDSGQLLGSSSSFGVRLGDLDGDGDLDAFVANFNQADKVWLNNGVGTFTENGQSLGDAASFNVQLADVDGDGDLDAFVTSFINQANKVWLNDGFGAFTDSGQALGSSNSWEARLTDLDGDGDLDAFVANGAFGNGQANQVWLNDLQAGISDNCGIASLTLDNETFSCANIGTNTVTLTVTDVNGNSAACSATVTVQDNIAPTALCQDVTVQLNADGNGMTTAAAVDNGSTDACGIANLTLDTETFTCADIGSNTVTLTVTDVNGNAETCTAQVTVVDNRPPSALCQDVTVQLDASGTGSTTAAAVDNGSTDNCGIASRTLDTETFTCADKGPNTVTLTVTDGVGDAATCTATVMVEDNNPPTALCADFTVNLSQGSASIAAVEIDGGSSSVCNDVSLSVDQTTFDCSYTGPNTVTLTVTDTGNTLTAECEAIVTVVDPDAFCCAGPVAICNDITVELGSDGLGSTTAELVGAGSTADCGLQSEMIDFSSFGCEHVGDEVVTYTITDVNGASDNCTATITVEDNIRPTISCPGDDIVPTNPGLCTFNYAVTPPQANDNCGVTVLRYRWRPTDENGANTGPWSAWSTAPNQILDVGHWKFQWQARDAAGNQRRCSYRLEVEDSAAPSVSCPASVEVPNDPGACGAIVDFAATATDNCSGVSITYSQDPQTFFPVGVTTVTVTATDASGLFKTCSFAVEVNDTERPTLNCSGLNLTVPNDPGECEAEVELPVPIAADNCGIETLEFRYRPVDDDNNALGPWTAWTDGSEAYGTFPVGRYRIRWRTFDEAGNSRACTRFLTVEDVEPPTVNCFNQTIVFNGEASIPLLVEDLAEASDNCGVASLTQDINEVFCGDLGEEITVTVTAVDVSGLANTCTSKIYLEGLPCGWSQQPDGVGCDEGSAGDYEVSTETFTLNSTNCYNGPGSNTDEYAFAQYNLCGNGEIIAQVTDISGTSFGWAGVIMRESNDPQAKSVALMTNLSVNHRREARIMTGGPLSSQLMSSFGRHWLRIQRVGNQFRAYSSFNGNFWALRFAQTIPMEECLEVGLVVNGYFGSGELSATFANVSVQGTTFFEFQAGAPAVEETVNTKTFTVFPNPTAGQVTVTLGDFLEEEARLEVLDVNGQVVQLVREGILEHSTEQLNLGQLPAGMYFVRLQLADGTVRTQRVVLQPRL